MTAQDLLEAGLGLLLLAVEWMWAHVWTLVAVVFGFAVLYQLSEIRSFMLGAWSSFGALGSELNKLRDEVEELKDAVADLKDELPNKRR